MRPTERHILTFLAQHPDDWSIPTRIPDLKGNPGKVSGEALRALRIAGLIEYGREPQHSLYGYRLTALGTETELALRHSLESYDRISRRIIDGNGEVVALALMLANDRWCLSDTNGTRTGKASFASPKETLAQFVKLRIEAAMALRSAEPGSDADGFSPIPNR